jgi:hypothetical protein
VTQELSTGVFEPGGNWSVGPADPPLADGTYTAQAAQTIGLETGVSVPVTFTVETAAPVVTLNSPGAALVDTTPSFTGSASDTTPVTVQIHLGPTAKGVVVSKATATGTRGSWTSGKATPALSIGQYTAVATQPSSLGNPAGRSGAVTFTIVPPPTPPLASFTWFPPVPQAGEPVSLSSNSSDPKSPITGIAWDLAGSGAFQAGGAALTTTFPTPGAHVVRLLVTNAAGLSSVTAQAIGVVARRPSLMAPFPVVRIAGRETASGLRLTLLKVQQMPAGARMTVRCRGRRCPLKSARRVAASTKHGVAPVEFRKFERFLRFGVTLEILVTKPGEIGKYTRFAIRRGRLPERIDMCLDQTGITPLVCPSS